MKKIKTTEEAVVQLASIIREITRLCQGLGTMKGCGATTETIIGTLGIIGEFHEKADELLTAACSLSVNKSIYG